MGFKSFVNNNTKSVYKSLVEVVLNLFVDTPFFGSSEFDRIFVIQIIIKDIN